MMNLYMLAIEYPVSGLTPPLDSNSKVHPDVEEGSH